MKPRAPGPPHPSSPDLPHVLVILSEAEGPAVVLEHGRPARLPH